MLRDEIEYRGDDWHAALESRSCGSSEVAEGDVGMGLGSNIKPSDSGLRFLQIPVCNKVAASSETFFPCISTRTHKPPPRRFMAASITALC